MMKSFVFNGKFLAQRMAGVQRVAYELISELARLQKQGDPAVADMKFRIAAPANAKEVIPDVEIVKGRMTGTIWEQAELPSMVGNDQLVNLCNVGPVVHRGDITMLHDAQAFISPQSYSLPFRLWYRTVTPYLARRAKRVLTVSDYSRRSLIEYGIAPAEKIAVVLNGVDHVLRVDTDQSVIDRLQLRGKRFFSAPASIQAHKNIGILIRAAAMLRYRDVPLVLIGGATKEDFASRGFTPPENVIFAGRLNDAEMFAVIRNSIAFAFPSTTEGFGLPPLEAMLLGTPAVIAPCGALPEVCGESAIVAAAESPEAWAAALDALAENQAQRDRWAALGTQRASSYSWNRSARQLAEIMRTA